MSVFEAIGRQILFFLEEVGRVITFFGQTVKGAFRLPFRLRTLFAQMEAIGVHSVPVALITAIFTGMVLSLQSFNGFKRFNAEGMVGTVVALSMTRELGPVLTGFIVAGRAGAAMAAELGTMKVTEQIDALATMAVNPVRFLVVPRILAGMIMLPLLTVMADFTGIIGGYFIAVKTLGANPTVYIRRTTEYLVPGDILGGLFKAAVFGILISTISCHKGFTAEGGAKGVGRATTGAVVVSEILILVSDYFLTVLLF